MEIKYNFPLARFTSYRVGGNAKIYFRPNNLEDLILFLQEIPVTENLLWLGLGSNVLIRDGGFDGIVIHYLNTLNNLAIIQKCNEGIRLKAGVGVTCSNIAKFCVKYNLEDGIWFAGIPGTIGGALKMNAGAFGGEIWKHVRSVEVINRKGIISYKVPLDYNIGYRSVIKVNSCEQELEEYFIAAELFFKYSIPNAHNLNFSLQQKINDLLIARKLTQPIGTLNCGSVFKNPTNNWAGKLIEFTNLKGKRLGNAVVSEKHANFIINLGNATARDIEGLINLVKAEVFAKHGIWLETEVKIIGNL